VKQVSSFQLLKLNTSIAYLLHLDSGHIPNVAW